MIDLSFFSLNLVPSQTDWAISIKLMFWYVTNSSSWIHLCWSILLNWGLLGDFQYNMQATAWSFFNLCQKSAKKGAKIVDNIAEVSNSLTEKLLLKIYLDSNLHTGTVLIISDDQDYKLHIRTGTTCSILRLSWFNWDTWNLCIEAHFVLVHPTVTLNVNKN